MKGTMNILLALMCVSIITIPQRTEADEIVQYVTSSDGTMLVAQENGNPKGQPILFIHGFTGTHFLWKSQVKSKLADDFRLITFDLRGHGFSEKSPENPQATYGDPGKWADDVKAVIDHFGLSKPVIVAWSYGGTVVLDYVKKYGQDALSGLVLVAIQTGVQSHVSPALLELGLGLIGMEKVADGPPKMARDTYMTMYHATLAHSKAGAAKPLPKHLLIESFAGRLMTPIFVRFGIAALRPPQQHEQTLASITVPVLAVHGSKDNAILPVASDFIVRTVKNGKKVIYPGVGHMAPIENTNQFNQDLREFAESIGK